ncbi:lipopolysaccharide assembly protein LapA domain-containing protein [Litorivita sp. NS0012-18]|uniref:LapA family protein n=1 Tax=Litorivita sp. NS0012-18 TaxID=3127655 RepID=UPI0031045B0F
MRYIRYASIAIFALALISIALANRQMVTVKVLPEELAVYSALNPSVSMPLFLVIFGGIIAGLVIGFVWEWMREHKHRSEARRKHGEVKQLERELRRVKGQRDEGKDEVLALLDEAS